MSLKFGLTRASLSVELDGQPYRLYEASAADIERIRVVPHEQSNALMVHCCLKDPQDHPVPLNTIKGWPAQVVQALAMQIAKLTGIDKEVEEVAAEAKNSQSDTPAS
jgi:hypothetical protein